MYKYIGPMHYPGVPARDLTNGEWEAISEPVQKMLLESGVYEAPGKPSAKKAVKEDEESNE